MSFKTHGAVDSILHRSSTFYIRALNPSSIHTSSSDPISGRDCAERLSVGPNLIHYARLVSTLPGQGENGPMQNSLTRDY